jgi:ABC-type sugar transport system ATPase subunit
LPEQCKLGIRPEDVRVDPEGEFAGEIILTEPLGVETVLHVKIGEQTLLSTQSGITHFRPGDTIRCDIVRERLHFFDREGERI